MDLSPTDLTTLPLLPQLVAEMGRVDLDKERAGRGFQEWRACQWAGVEKEEGKEMKACSRVSLLLLASIIFCISLLILKISRACSCSA